MATNRITINGIEFPIKGFGRLQNISVPPNPVVFGDNSQTGDSAAMIQLIQSSWAGGEGMYKGNSRTDTERFRSSTLDTRSRVGLTLNPMAYRTTRPPGPAASGDVGFIVPFRNVMYCGIEDVVSSWADTGVGYTVTAVASTHENVQSSGTGWTTSQALPSGALCSDAVVYGGNLFVAWQTGHSYLTSAGVWTDVAATDITYFTRIDQSLVGISYDPTTELWQLKHTPDGTTWTTPATAVILARDFTVTDLVTYRDANGLEKVWAITDGPPFIYDWDNAIFRPADLDLWKTNTVSLGTYPKATVWRDRRLYMMTGGNGVAAIQAGNPLVATPVGTDRDYGSETAESFRNLVSDINFVYAHVQEAGGLNTLIKAWNGSGWHTMWSYPQASVGHIASGLGIGTSDDRYRLWWEHARNIYFMDLDSSIYNPLVQTTRNYGFGPQRLTTPWWEFGTGIQRKVQGHLWSVARGITGVVDPHARIGVEYQKDFDETAWTAFELGAILGNGIRDLTPGNTGIQHRYIRYRITMYRDPSLPLTTPVLEVFASEVMRVLPPTFAYGFEIDLTQNQPIGRRTVAQLIDELKKLCDPDDYAGFYPLVYNGQTTYGRISRINGQEATPQSVEGHGTYLISFIAPYP